MSRQTAQPLIWLARKATRSIVDRGIPALLAASFTTFPSACRARMAPGTMSAGLVTLLVHLVLLTLRG